MNINNIDKIILVILSGISLYFNPVIICAQPGQDHIISFEDYMTEYADLDEDYLSTIEDWQNMISQWLVHPLFINGDDAGWLVEYKIISLYQLNKLKEYRYIYGDLLSIYELSFIEGWDFQTCRKVMPLVSTCEAKKMLSYKKFSIRNFRHDLIIRTGFNTAKSKGYQETKAGEDSLVQVAYSGPPYRVSIRYDLEYRNKVTAGIRMDKDAGEPLLISETLFSVKIRTPDLLTGYIHIKELGPIRAIVIGNYRINFGYGISLGGGQPRISGQNGLSGMAGRIRPQTSSSESGYFRGIAVHADFVRFSLAMFGSSRQVDGASVITDTASGSPLTFTSINTSGLHRTDNELDNRKFIKEQVLGGYGIYQNNWLKTGLIAVFSRYNATVEQRSDPYSLFGFTGRENLVTGIATTIWLPKLQLFNETSLSHNKGLALLTGLQAEPSPGFSISLAHRYFDTGYQNWLGSGYITSSKNNNESGIRLSVSAELAKKWLIIFTTDLSETKWASYGLDAPGRNWQVQLVAEKSWSRTEILSFSTKYLKQTIEDQEHSIHLVSPATTDQYKFRLEYRNDIASYFRFKSRIECCMTSIKNIGWSLIEDVECTPGWCDLKIWLRCCFFDVDDYKCRIYAYENDVLYDFTSAMLYGKGLKGIIMFRLSANSWLDLWLRFSTIYYTNKNIGTGTDEIGGNRQNEIEIQARVKFPG